MEQLIKVNFRDLEVKEFPINTTLLKISESFKKYFNYPILAGKINNDISNLNTKITEDSYIDFYDRSSAIGNNIYSNSCIFIMTLALKRVLGKDADVYIENSVDKGVYCRIINYDIDKPILDSIEIEMKNIVSEKLLFSKVNVKRLDAIKYFKNKKMLDKVGVLKYISNSYITLYKLDNIYDFFFSNMAYSTEDIDKFKLTYIEDNNFILNYPDRYNPEITLPYKHKNLADKTFKEYSNWQNVIGITKASDLNRAVSLGKSNEIIRLAEAHYDGQLPRIADMIYENKENIKLVLIAGASSSGKTTTAKKLEIYLQSMGLKTYNISIDDYYLNRNEQKKDENGEYDFETIKAIDVNLFNEHLTKLLNKEEVVLPTYNFKTGEKEYIRKPIKLKENEVIIIEGLHGLNDELTSSVARNNKFKIFIAPFTQLNIDNHNRIHTSDTRKLRRIIRDSKHRNSSAADTLKMWKKISFGEKKYIYSYQEDADAVINSALLYELGVLKTYVEPLLFSVKEDDEMYSEAIRLINFLRNFLPISSDAVPKDSVLREFIGGSGFNY